MYVHTLTLIYKARSSSSSEQGPVFYGIDGVKNNRPNHGDLNLTYALPPQYNTQTQRPYRYGCYGGDQSFYKTDGNGEDEAPVCTTLENGTTFSYDQVSEHITYRDKDGKRLS